MEIQGTGKSDFPGKPERRKMHPLWQQLGKLAAVALVAVIIGSMILVFHAASHSNTGTRVASGSGKTNATSVTGAGSKLGTTITTYTGQQGGILSLDWSPDGKYIASAGDGVQVWNALTGKRLFTFTRSGPLQSDFFVARWSPDGKRIAVGNGAGNVYVLNATNGHVLLTFTYPATTAYASYSYEITSSPFTYHSTTTPYVMSTLGYEITSSPREVLKPASGGPAIYALAWSPDGKYIASSAPFQGGDNSIQVWNATSGKVVMRYTKHMAPVGALAWSPNGKYIVSASDGIADTTVKVWNPLTGQTVSTYRDPALGQHDSYSGVAWSPDSSRVASYDDNGTVQVWQALTGKHIQTFQADDASLLSSPPLAWSPDGQRIVTAGASAQIWDVSIGKLLFSYKGQTVPSALPGSVVDATACVRTVAWSPNGKYIASGSSPDVASSTVKVWVA